MPQGILEVLDLPRPEVAVEEVVDNLEPRLQKMCQQLTSTSSRLMPSSARRIWSRRLSLDRQLERPHLTRHPQPSQLFRQVGTTSQPPFSITSQAKPRNGWKVVETDQVGENGAVKNRRRTWKHSARAVLIMDIAADIVDEDVAVGDTEAVATAEMANQAVDVADIEDVATHKQQCSNCIFAHLKSYWTYWAFLTLYQKLSICFFGRCWSKNCVSSTVSGDFLCSARR